MNAWGFLIKILFIALATSWFNLAHAQKAEGIGRVIPININLIKEGQVEIKKEGADFIKVHFQEMKLPKGVYIEVSNQDGSEAYQYFGEANSKSTFSQQDLENNKKSFSAMSITGDTAIVRVVGNKGLINRVMHKSFIDYYVEGDFDRIEESGNSFPDGAGYCGDTVHKDVSCFENSHPEFVERSRPTARIIYRNGGGYCTAWRVGADNHMITNNHCVNSQEDITGSEVWFNYQATTCDGNTTTIPIKVAANVFYRTIRDYDITIFSVHDFSSIQSFGHYGLDVRFPELAEPLYIPNHGGGYPKYLSLESDIDATGYCRVIKPLDNGYIPGSDVGYYCDTRGGSSGSPVLSGNTNRVVALHHFGAGTMCTRSGVKINAIWPHIKDLFGGVVPSGDGQLPAPQVAENQVPVADFTYSCNGNTCEFDASNSYDPDGEIIWYSWGSPQMLKTFSDSGYDQTYDVKLVVMDNDGALHEVIKHINTIPQNYIPSVDFYVTCTNENCTTTKNQSSDPDGQIVNYRWSWGDGTVVEGPNLDFPSHTYSSSGYFDITLTVTDDKGLSNSHTMGKNIYSLINSNRAPRANFNASCVANIYQCSFSNYTYDLDDDIIAEYHWDFGDGNTSTEAEPTHTYAQAQHYNVTLMAIDEHGNRNTYLKIVNAYDYAPKNRPESNFDFSCSGLSCSFTEKGTDPDDDIIAYLWEFGDGSISNHANPIHSYSQAGTYWVALTVFDNYWAPHFLFKEVTVTSGGEPEPNQAPVAAITATCDDLSCDFDASNSSDSDGNVVEYAFTYGDGFGSNGALSSTSHNYSAAGTYTVTVTVTDDDGAQDIATTTVTVNSPPPANEAPNAYFTYSCDNLTCSFNANGSSDSDGSIDFYQWGISDGTQKSGVTASHTFAASGNYNVQLTVTDNDGAQDQYLRTITVTAPPIDNPPTLAITSPANGATVSGTVLIQATATDDNGIASVKFYINGTLVKTDTSSPYNFSWDTTQEVNGSNSMQAVAYDSANQTDSASLSVNVNNASEPPADTEKPSVSITSPAEGANFEAGSRLTLQASASDNVAVSNVKFYVDGSLICTDSTANYSCSWRMPNAKNKTYNIQAVAVDSSGNLNSDVISISTVSSPGDGGSDKPCRGKKCQ